MRAVPTLPCLAVLCLAAVAPPARGSDAPPPSAEMMAAAQALLDDGYTSIVGSSGAAIMVRVPGGSVMEVGGRSLPRIEFLAARATPRTDGGMSSRSSWVFDCDAGTLSIVELTSHEDRLGVGAEVARQSWNAVEIRTGLRVPGPHSLGRKMVRAACR